MIDESFKKELTMNIVRYVIGYGILIPIVIFILVWDCTLLAIYGVVGFKSLWEFLQVLVFILLSFIFLWIVDLGCSKILPKNSLNFRTIVLEWFS